MKKHILFIILSGILIFIIADSIYALMFKEKPILSIHKEYECPYNCRCNDGPSEVNRGLFVKNYICYDGNRGTTFIFGKMCDTDSPACMR